MTRMIMRTFKAPSDRPSDPPSAQVELGLSRVKVLWVGLTEVVPQSSTVALKVTLVEYVEPLTKVSWTWQTPAASLEIADLAASHIEARGRSSVGDRARARYIDRG